MLKQNKLSKNASENDGLFIDIIRQHNELMQLLVALREIENNAYLAAGVIRNLVWCHLHQQAYILAGTEIDVIYHDPHQNEAHQQQLAACLNNRFEDQVWDVVNQAHVHRWYRTEQGQCIAALSSIEQALSLWPETATAVAVRLNDDNKLDVIAPFGLEDLMSLKIRYNPALVSLETCIKRVNSKQFLQRWPKLSWA